MAETTIKALLLGKQDDYQASRFMAFDVIWKHYARWGRVNEAGSEPLCFMGTQSLQRYWRTQAPIRNN